jgi:hypothetical protein
VATNDELTLDGILMTMFEPGNPASERVVDYVRRPFAGQHCFRHGDTAHDCNG